MFCAWSFANQHAYACRDTDSLAREIKFQLIRISTLRNIVGCGESRRAGLSRTWKIFPIAVIIHYILPDKCYITADVCNLTIVIQSR